MLIRVTAEDLTNPVMGSTTDCAVVRAMRRHYPAALVGINSYTPDGNFWHSLPS